MLAALGVVLLCATQSRSQPQDYFLMADPAQRGFMSPFGSDRERSSNIGFDYVSLPPVVAPGQEVPVELQWSFLDPIAPNAVIYMNAFGDWQPDRELARLINGELAGQSRTVLKSFTFTAPTTPGTYRIRVPFVESFATVTNFYGGPPGAPGDVLRPGVGAYTEVSFQVANPWQLSLQMYAGLVLTGPPGNYTIDCLNDADQTSWTILTNVTVTSSPQFWLDRDSVKHPRRFYRAIPMQ